MLSIIIRFIKKKLGIKSPSEMMLEDVRRNPITIYPKGAPK